MGIRKRHVVVCSWAVVTVAAATAAVAGTRSAPHEDFAVVSPAGHSGWRPAASGGSSVAFVEGPSVPWSGTGSVELRVDAEGESAAGLRNPGYDGTLLAELTELSYLTFVERSRGYQAAYVVLDVDYDGDDLADDHLVFEPAYQNDEHFPSYPQPIPARGTWQWWDALNGGWWSLRATADAEPGVVKSLWDILALEPGARIVNAGDLGGVRVAAGHGSRDDWAEFVGNVDGLSIGVNGEATYFDFEADRDGDGVADTADARPESDLRRRVDVDGFEPGTSAVANACDEGGVTIQDRVNRRAEDAPNHGAYVRGMQALVDELCAEGRITPEQARDLLTAASRSSVADRP